MNGLDAFYEGGPKTWSEAFPPVCVTSHWDPTKMAQHILPFAEATKQPVDPRPSVKICTSYTSLSQDQIPDIPSSRPYGSAAFPYRQYAENVGKESDLLRLTEPLTKCSEKRYIPAILPAQTNILPGVDVSNRSILSPFVTEVKTEAGCRKQDDEEAWSRSQRLFSNPTRYDRTTTVLPPK